MSDSRKRQRSPLRDYDRRREDNHRYDSDSDRQRDRRNSDRYDRDRAYDRRMEENHRYDSDSDKRKDGDSDRYDSRRKESDKRMEGDRSDSGPRYRRDSGDRNELRRGVYRRDSERENYRRNSQYGEERNMQLRRPSYQSRGGSSSEPEVPPLYSIHRGVVLSLTDFGLFVKLDGYSKHGLVHISQVAKRRIESKDLSEHVAINENVWVKVIQVGEDESGKVKLNLSMKFVNQSNGADLDPNNVDLTMQQQKLKQPVHSAPISGPKFIEFGAVLDTVCGRCGEKGHFASDCFHIVGQEVQQLLEEDYSLPVEPAKVPDEDKKKEKKEKKAKDRKKDKKDKKDKKKKKSKKRKREKEDKKQKKKEEKKKKKQKTH